MKTRPDIISRTVGLRIKQKEDFNSGIVDVVRGELTALCFVLEEEVHAFCEEIDQIIEMRKDKRNITEKFRKLYYTNSFLIIERK